MIRTDPAFEAYLARLYVETKFRLAFLKNPRAHALESGLTVEQADALTRIDRQGLILASRSFAIKRNRMH